MGKAPLATVMVMLSVIPGAALAQYVPKHQYPTQARVEFVFDCMNKLGGQSYDTLYKCSCAIDHVADQLSYDNYVTLDTYQKGQYAHGERPEELREGSLARNSRSELAKAKEKAAKACLIDPDKLKPANHG